ncbi:type II secretion system protein GspL [Alteromonas sp. H39]|uniref:type II secretion system protein GspL n=1 Tax=Alteromonas sp. H39 TaxID=3389876 RepID=UPI0039E11113
MEQLLVRLGSKATDPVHWLVWSSSEEEIIASDELVDAQQLSTLSERAGQRPVIALAPTSDILMKWVELPPKASRKILSAIPFMLEDELATDISKQFFAIGPKQGNHQAVAVVAHEQMDAWQGWLASAGLYCDTIMPDVLAVPEHEGGWALLTLGEQVLLREDSWKGMQGEIQWMLPLLTHYAKQSETPVSIANYSDLDISGIPNTEQQSAPLELPMHVLAKEAMECKFNLLQGDYKVRKKRSGVSYQWRVAAVLAVLALTTALVDKGITLYQLKNQNEALRVQISDTVDAGFPNIGVYRDVRRKVRSELAKLEQGGGSASMLVMLDQLAGAFNETKVKPQTLRFDANRTEIRIQAEGDSFESLEQFRRIAENAGFVVEQGAINNRDDGVVGSVSIRSTS